MTNPTLHDVSRAIRLATFVSLPTKAPAKVVKARALAHARPTVYDDPREEMTGSSPVAAARRRERARCAAILGHPAAASNMVLAANLAFNSRLPRAEALEVLKDSVATVTSVPKAQADASRWDRAFAAVRPALK